MSKQNVRIVSTGIFYPPKRISMDQYIQHFQKRGIRIDGLLKSLGRKYKKWQRGRFSLSCFVYRSSIDSCNSRNL